MIFVRVVELEDLALYHNARWHSWQVVNEQVGEQAGITESIPASQQLSVFCHQVKMSLVNSICCFLLFRAAVVLQRHSQVGINGSCNIWFCRMISSLAAHFHTNSP